MITPFDDYPVHQTSLPLAQTAGGDPNHYDRFFFNGYDPGGAWYIGVALGLYPNRGVIDAAVSVVRDGVQRSVFASGRIPDDRTQTRVGPIAIQILEPLGRNRVTVDAEGLSVDLVWTPRTRAFAEPRQYLVQDAVTVMDVTRIVQFGAWGGAIDVEGEHIAVDATSRGTKDRSWGIRPVGHPVPGAPAPGLIGGGFSMAWAVLQFDDRCLHGIVFEQADGRRLFSSSATVPVGDAEPTHVDLVHDVEFEPGTRRARRAALTFGDEQLELTPITRFQMKGIGYMHPQWAHGVWHGESATGTDVWKLDELDPLDITNLHVQQLCRVSGGGVGVLEQLIIGPHAPSGFTDLLDGAR